MIPVSQSSSVGVSIWNGHVCSILFPNQNWQKKMTAGLLAFNIFTGSILGFVFKIFYQGQVLQVLVSLLWRWVREEKGPCSPASLFCLFSLGQYTYISSRNIQTLHMGLHTPLKKCNANYYGTVEDASVNKNAGWNTEKQSKLNVPLS